MSAPLAYLVLGASGAGRRAVLADLIANGLGDGPRSVVLTAIDEPAPEEAVATALASITGLALGTWTLDEAGRMDATVPDDTTHIFFIADGAADPVGQVEAFHGWLGGSGAELARVITVVHCALGHAHPQLKRWHEACVHFSDAVLLGRRENVPNPWVGEFTTALKKQRLPCLVELVKKGGSDNPAVILEPQARRISVLFDADNVWPDIEIDGDDEDGDDDAEVGPDGDMIGRTDPWIERMPSGRRVKELPDIRLLLGR